MIRCRSSSCDWFGGVLRFDFGESIFIGEPVTRALLDRAQPTILLTIYALLVQIVIGIPAGVISAVKHNSIFDRLLTVIAISGAAIPTFFLGILLILFFAVRLQLAAIRRVRRRDRGSRRALQGDDLARVRAGLLVGRAARAAGALVHARRDARGLRADRLRQGPADALVVIRHALRNALIPALTVIGTSVGALLGGAVVTETVFTIPGMGRLVVQSIARRDYPVIQGAVM